MVTYLYSTPGIAVFSLLAAALTILGGLHPISDDVRKSKTNIL